MQKDLNMSNYEYSIALTVTYVPYIAAELPSNLMLRVNSPTIKIAVVLKDFIGSGSELLTTNTPHPLGRCYNMSR
jgi:hypothetical protein